MNTQNRDSILESKLTKLGIRFQFEEAFPLSKIDYADPEAAENTRLGEPLDEENVRSLVEAYRAGDPVPAIVLEKDGLGNLKWISGRHRTEGAKQLKFETLPAYILEIPDERTRFFLRSTANDTHGKQVKFAQRVRLAAIGVTKYGETLADAAQARRIPIAVLEKEMGKMQLFRALEAEHVDPEQISKGNLVDLLKLPTNEAVEVMKSASGVRIPDLREKIRSIFKSADRIAAVRDLVESNKVYLEKTGNGTFRFATLKDFNKFFVGITKTLGPSGLPYGKYQATELSEFKQMVNGVLTLLKATVDGIEKDLAERIR